MVLGSLRSQIAARGTKVYQKKHLGRYHRMKHHWKKLKPNGSRQSISYREKERKVKRDLVSIVPNHRLVKPESVEQSNDVILDTKNEGRHHAVSGADGLTELRTGSVGYKNLDTTAENKGNYKIKVKIKLTKLKKSKSTATLKILFYSNNIELIENLLSTINIIK